jgi:hypothetical protein
LHVNVKIYDPVPSALHPKRCKKLDQTGLSNTTGNVQVGSFFLPIQDFFLVIFDNLLCSMSGMASAVLASQWYGKKVELAAELALVALQISGGFRWLRLGGGTDDFAVSSLA